MEVCASVAQWLEQQPCKLNFDEKGVDWASFEEYLVKKHSRGHAKGVLNYAMKYADCLLKEDFSELCDLAIEKRRNILTALSNLSKFSGKREVFKRLMRDYGLKWQTTKAEDLLISRMAKVEEHGEVLEWMREVKANFPQLDALLDLLLVSGVRFAEAVNSYNLIIDLGKERKLDSYYNAEKEVLQHFRFRHLFLRNTKKVFVSFVPEHLVQRIAKRQKLTVCQIRNPIKRSGLGLRFGEIRDYFATYMTKWLNPAEIDFLQGRVSASVFMKHYFNPALLGDLKTRVFKGIASLRVVE